jgi:hypothetical protein
MSRITNLPGLLLLFALLSMVPLANNLSSQDKHEEFWQFVQTVQDILAGKNVEQAQSIIPQGAGLVYGARFEDLKSVVAGQIKSCSLADTSYHGVMIQAKTNPSEDAGFLILKTQKYDTTKVRFHTIVFMKDSTGKYKINIWHTGDYDH